MWCKTLLRSTAAIAVLMCLTAAGAGTPDGTRTLVGYARIIGVTVSSTFYGPHSAVNRPLTDGELAYDYSVHLMTELQPSKLYRLYSGGRWRVIATGWDGDHVLQHTSTSGTSGTWTMPHTPQRPEFPRGTEEGAGNVWYAGNCMEPEVLKVNGTYYMYTQVQIAQGAPIDQAGLTASVPDCDRIQLHTSNDGLNWTRWSTQRGVVTNLTNPQQTQLHHEECVYVPWDATGRPWWMYVGVTVQGTFTGYWRLRSSDPTTYDFSTREVANLGEVGNQIGYMKNAPGGPLFIRISFINDGTGRMVPTLQFSRDGLAWQWGVESAFELHGSDDPNSRNCYFLGLSTINGAGELEQSDTQGLQYTAIYGASTSNSAVAPDIFYSDIGIGRLDVTINPNTSAAQDWALLQ